MGSYCYNALVVTLLLVFSTAFVTTTYALNDYDEKHSDVKRTILSPSDASVVSAAEFAIRHLSTLSESGVYESIQLQKIHAASVGTGVFHSNLFLSLGITSPFFLSGNTTEALDVVVMTHVETAEKNLAFESFPKMTENSIEAHWIKMVDAHRFARNLKFKQWEEEEHNNNMIIPAKDEL